MVQLSDESLMESYQKGDEGAFSELYQRYQGRVYGFLKARCADVGVVDDLFQLTFQKLHQYRHRYDSKYLFSAWIFTICRHNLVDHFRRKSRDGEVGVDLEAFPVEETSVAGLEISELAQLPARQASAIQLRFEKDLDFDEIAKVLGTSEENSRQLVSRGLRKLKGLLQR